MVMWRLTGSTEQLTVLVDTRFLNVRDAELEDAAAA